MNMIGNYRINVLGRLKVLGPDGGAVTLSTRKAEAILALLAATSGFKMSRDRLISLIWSTRDDTQARGSLRQALFALRKALPGLLHMPEDAERDMIGLDASMVTVDLHMMSLALAAADDHALSAIARASNGEFLEGLVGLDPALDDWITTRARDVTEMQINLHERLVRHQLGNGDSTAVATALRLVEFDPLRESSHRLVISAHAASGNRALALQQYQGLVRLLLTELDVEPDAESKALHQRVSGGETPKVSFAANPGKTPDGYKAPAIAVLPFRNLSGDASKEYFSDGITEDLVTALSCGRHFPVVGRHTMAQFKNQSRPATEIGMAVSSRYLVEGTVQHAGGRLRVHASLTDCESGHEIWSKRLDREAGDLFDMQDALVSEIVQAIGPTVSTTEQGRARASGTDSLDAWERSQLALWHIHRGSEGDYATARRLLENVIREQPYYSYPRGLLALTVFHQSLYGWSDNPPKAMGHVLQVARDAVAVDQSDWLAHALLGIALLWSERRYDLARLSLQRALDLNPYASIAQQLYGCVCGFSGELVEAEKSQLQVIELDPNFQFITTVLSDLALEFYLRGDYEGALGYLDKSLARQPGYVRALQRKLATLAMMGRDDEAAAVLQQLKLAQPVFQADYFQATYPFKISAHRESFNEGLRRGGLNP